jgi:hypothetical protein
MKSLNPKPILVSFVNSHFGPVRGLNFLVEDAGDSNLESWLQTQPGHLISAIWAQTALSTRAIVMPTEMLADLETPPKQVKTLAAGEVEILKAVRSGTLTGDPFYFRAGVM